MNVPCLLLNWFWIDFLLPSVGWVKFTNLKKDLKYSFSRVTSSSILRNMIYVFFFGGGIELLRYVSFWQALIITLAEKFVSGGTVIE